MNYLDITFQSDLNLRGRILAYFTRELNLGVIWVMNTISIAGCGDIGSRLAKSLQAPGTQVYGWVRSNQGLQRLKKSGIEGIRVDLDDKDTGFPEIAGQRLFYFVPPPPVGRLDSRVANLIAHLSIKGSPTRVVYLSTSGVYGDCRGAWVDESRPPAPAADRSFRRLDAEQRWRSWSEETGGELVILRVAGIYGPGKLPVKRLESRQPMVSEEVSPITNHIHSLDLVSICQAAMERGRSGEVYNVCDGSPDSMAAYFNQVADFLQLPRPPVITGEQAERQLSAGMRSYLGESRRLSNRKMLEELRIELRYPTLEQGLPASL
jgi:nucleoside-diphosphate-sugar epimerase